MEELQLHLQVSSEPSPQSRQRQPPTKPPTTTTAAACPSNETAPIHSKTNKRPEIAQKVRIDEPPKKQPRFQNAINPSKSLLKAAASGDAATVSGLLCRLREEEDQHTSERASLQLQLKKESQRALKAEAAVRRAEDQRDFRLGEVRHLKAALQRRDDLITALQDQVRELEVGVTLADALQTAEGKKNVTGFEAKAEKV